MSGPDQKTIDPDWFAGNIILSGPWSEFKCSGPWSEIFVDNFRPVRSRFFEKLIFPDQTLDYNILPRIRSFTFEISDHETDQLTSDHRSDQIQAKISDQLGLVQLFGRVRSSMSRIVWLMKND